MTNSLTDVEGVLVGRATDVHAATGTRTGDVNTIGLAAAEATAEAILRVVQKARPLHGVASGAEA